MSLPDVATIDTYGGTKANYQLGVVDDETDRDADDVNTCFADTAMMTHTALKTFVRFVTANTSTPALAASFPHDAQWGTSVAPTPAYVSTGTYTFTFPTTVTNELGETKTLALRTASPGEVGGTTFYSMQVSVTAANVVTVRIFDAAGALVNSTSVTMSFTAL